MATYLAGESGSLAIVNGQVGLQPRSLTETFLAYGATVGIVTFVLCQVATVNGFQCKASATYLTVVAVLACAGISVSLHVAAVGKGAAAVVAGKGPFACVGADVYLEVPVTGKGFGTDVADVGLLGTSSMCLHMGDESLQGGALLATHLTPKTLLRVLL